MNILMNTQFHTQADSNKRSQVDLQVNTDGEIIIKLMIE